MAAVCYGPNLLLKYLITYTLFRYTKNICITMDIFTNESGKKTTKTKLGLTHERRF